MKLSTTIVDDMDLGVPPTNYRADPVKRTAVGKGTLGHVHFLWPIGERLRNLTLYYDRLTLEHARRLLTALAPSSSYNRVLLLDPAGPTWFIPGKVTLHASFEGGYVSVRVETIARRFGPVSTETFAPRTTGVPAPTPTPVSAPDFYWYSLRDVVVEGWDDFTVERRNSDGSLVWQVYSEYGWEDPDGPDFQLFYDINMWPGWPHATSTRQGMFVPCADGRTGLAQFFLVTPDGQPGGRVLPVSGAGDWGVEATEDASGDHYAIYYGASGGIIVAGWNGMSSAKWERNRPSLISEGVIRSGGDSFPASIALSPDNAVVVVLFSDDTLAGFSASTGATLWHSRSLWNNVYQYRWEGNQRVRFAPGGHAFVQTLDQITTTDPEIGYVHRLNWPNGYGALPSVAWTHVWVDPHSVTASYQITGIAPLPDGGVLVQGWPGFNAPFYSSLKRLAGNGSVLWEHNNAVPYDAYYSVIHADSLYGYVTTGQQLRRVSLATGAFDEAGTEFPIAHDLHIGLAKVSS